MQYLFSSSSSRAARAPVRTNYRTLLASNSENSSLEAGPQILSPKKLKQSYHEQLERERSEWFLKLYGYLLYVLFICFFAFTGIKRVLDDNKVTPLKEL